MTASALHAGAIGSPLSMSIRCSEPHARRRPYSRPRLLHTDGIGHFSYRHPGPSARAMLLQPHTYLEPMIVLRA